MVKGETRLRQALVGVLLLRTFRRWDENAEILHTFRRWEGFPKVEMRKTDGHAPFGRGEKANGGLVSR